ncbi:Vacuolar protein 8 [Plasmodiophora brassicae]
MDPVIDLEMALRQVSDDKEFLMELLNDMVAGKDKLFESMNEAIRCNDPKQFRVAGHTIKGAALNLGLKALGAQAKCIELFGDAVFVGANTEPFAEKSVLLVAQLDTEYDRCIARDRWYCRMYSVIKGGRPAQVVSAEAMSQAEGHTTSGPDLPDEKPGPDVNEEGAHDSDSFVDEQVAYDDTPANIAISKTSDEEGGEDNRAKAKKIGLGAAEDADKDAGHAAASPIEEMVTFAGEDRDTNERRQAAFSFAHFSTEEESQFAIVKMKRNYGIHAVLSLLHSGDHICQRYAALCLGNIAAHPELRKDLVKNNILEQMIPIAISKTDIDLDTQRQVCERETTGPETAGGERRLLGQYAIMAVANLAAEYDTHKLLMKHLPSILDLVDSPDRDLHECAVLTVQNVSSNKKLTKKLKLIIGPLVNMIANPLMDVESITHAVSALRGLTSDDNLKLELLRLNALKELVNLVDTIDRAELLVEIAATISGMANLIETHADMLQPSAINAIMVLALMDLNPQVQMHAANTLASLASNPDSHPNIVYANGIDNLVHLSMNRDPKVRQGATRALANLSSNRAYQGDMIHAGCLDVITAALRDNDDASLFFSTIMCAIISENTDYHPYICVKAILQPLALLITSGDTSQAELIRYAILSLSNLAANIHSHGLIMDEIQMQLTAFFELASSKDAEVQRYFAMLLSNLATNETLHEFLSSRACFQAVQNILNADSMTTVLSALSFISTMLRDNATRECFAGVSLKQIIDIAEKWPDVPYQIAVASVLGNVSKSTKVRNEYKWYRYLRLVEHFLEQESLDVQQEALHILVNLCDSEEVQRSMIGMRLLEYTMKAVRKGTMEEQSLGLHILARLCAGIPEILEDLKRNRIIQIVAPFVRSPHIAFRKYAFNGLGSFASHEHMPVDLMDVNLVKSFLSLAEGTQGDLEERRECMYALANVAFHLVNHEHLGDAGPFIFRGLPAFVETGDVEVLQHASLLMCNIVATMYTNAMFAVQAVMEVFIAVARCPDKTAKIQALSALCTLAMHEHNIKYMLQAGVTEFVLNEGLEWRKRDVSSTRQAATLLSGLTTYDVCVKEFGEARGVLVLVNMLDHSDVTVRRLVTRTFANFSYYPQYRQYIVRDGVFPLLKCLNDSDREIRHAAAWAIGHVLSWKDVQLKIARASDEDIYAQLIESADVDVQLACVWALANLHHEAAPLGSNNNDIHRLDNPSDELLQKLSKTALSKRVDSRISKYAIIAICNYTSVPRYHFTILRNCGEVIKRVFELAMRNDPEIRYCLALMLANLSGNLENHEFIATNVEMGRLSILVGCDDEETQGHAIATVSGLAISERNAKRIVESGLLIPQMSRECNSPHASVVRSVAAAFLNLAQHECILETLIEQDLVAGLLSLLKSPQADTQLPAARTMNIAISVPSGVQALLKLDLNVISRTLWNAVANGTEKVSAQVIRVLALLSTTDGAEAVLVNEQGIAGLIACAKLRAKASNDDTNCEFHSAVMIRKLCSLKDTVPMMVRLGAIDALLALGESVTGSQGVQELAITSLEDLLDHTSGLDVALNHPQVIDTLMKLLVSDKAAVQRHALGCIVRLSFHEDWTVRFRSRGGVKLVYKSARHKAYPIRAFAAWTMSVLSSYRVFFEELNSERSLKTLLYLADHDPEDARITLHVAVVLGNLSQYSAMIAAASVEQAQPFNPETSGMVPLFVRFLTSSNPLIASLAFMGMSAPSKTGPALIYMLRDDAMDLLAKLGATREELVLRMLAMALNLISSNGANSPFLKGRNLTGFDALFGFAKFDSVAIRWAALKTVNNMITEKSFNVKGFVLKKEYVDTLVEVATTNIDTDFGFKARFMALGIFAQLAFYQAYHDVLLRPDILRITLDTLKAAQRTISKTTSDRLNKEQVHSQSSQDDRDDDDSEANTAGGHGELDLTKAMVSDDPVLSVLLARDRDAVAEANAASTLANLAMNPSCYPGLLTSQAIEILTNFVNCSLSNPVNQSMAAETLCNLVFALTPTMIRQSQFFSMTNVADVMEALLKYGSGPNAILTERYMAVALCRLTCHPDFKVFSYDRPFFESRCLPAMLRSPDALTQKFTFLALVNIVLKADNLLELMEKENFVSLLLAYIQARDRSTKWLCLKSLMTLLQCGQGARYLSKDEYISTLLDLCFTDDKPIFTCVAHIIHSFVKQEGSIALRGKSDHLIPALAHLSTCADETTAMLGSETLGMFLDSRESMDMLLECSSEGFGAVLALLRSPKEKLRVQSLYSLAAISHNPEYANEIVVQKGLKFVCDLILADTIGDAMDCVHILRNVARNVANHHEFVQCNGIECLDVLSKHRTVDGDQKVQQLISQALSDIAHYFEEYQLGPERLRILVTAMVHPIRAIDQAGGSNIDASIVELSIFALNSLLVNDDCKWFAAEAGVVHPLMYIYETTPDQRLRRVSLALLLSLVECTRTQVAFARQGGVTLLRDMALSKDLVLKKKACRAFSKMSSNAAVQTLFVEFKILPILMVIRSHADLECRRLALDTLLSVLDNDEVQAHISKDDEVVNTVLALSKFGISTEVKARATRILVSLAQRKRAALYSKNNEQHRQRAARSLARPSLTALQSSFSTAADGNRSYVRETREVASNVYVYRSTTTTTTTTALSDSERNSTVELSGGNNSSSNHLAVITEDRSAESAPDAASTMPANTVALTTSASDRDDHALERPAAAPAHPSAEDLTADSAPDPACRETPVPSSPSVPERPSEAAAAPSAAPLPTEQPATSEPSSGPLPPAPMMVDGRLSPVPVPDAVIDAKDGGTGPVFEQRATASSTESPDAAPAVAAPSTTTASGEPASAPPVLDIPDEEPANLDAGSLDLGQASGAASPPDKDPAGSGPSN